MSKKKVFVAHFTAESNAAVNHKCEYKDFIFKIDRELIYDFEIEDLFKKADIELIPGFFALGHANGLVDKNVFDFISEEIFKRSREFFDEIDGMLLYLHGASCISNLVESSGELYILRHLRKMFGKYLPIAVVMDPHGNVIEEFCGYANIVRCFRESPHTDRKETVRIVATMLIDLLKNRAKYGHIIPIINKLPIMLGGERCVSADEPLKTINKKLDELEKDERILSASYHIGYLRHDDDLVGAAVVIVPSNPKYNRYCQEKCDELSKWIISNQKQFHFSGNAEEPEKAVQKAIEAKGLAVITDSGDNCSAGASGRNTFILNQLINTDLKDKKVLLCALNMPKVVEQLIPRNIGSRVNLKIGDNALQCRPTIKLIGSIYSKGKQLYQYSNQVAGPAVTIKCDDKQLYVTFINKPIRYGEIQQFVSSGLNVNDFDILVVKMGYIFPELKKIAKYYVMSLTDGETVQMTENLTYHKIMRPMYPIDKESLK